MTENVESLKMITEKEKLMVMIKKFREEIEVFDVGEGCVVMERCILPELKTK